MNLIRLLFRFSWIGVTVSAVTSLLTGVSSTGLIALVNLILSGRAEPNRILLWSFIALCIVVFFTTALSEIVTSTVTQQVIVNLRLLLTRQILACPLPHLEAIGAPRLLATLTEDVEAIANASLFISALGVNIALLIGCLIYLAWLSLPLFALLVVCIIFGVVTNQWLISRGSQFIKYAREEQDRLFEHFRTVTQGIKELKLHSSRRQDFLNQDLKVSLDISKRHRISATNFFAIGGSWGFVSLFIPIGLLLFVVPKITTISPGLIASIIVTFLFILTPIRRVLNSLPELIRANVALAKIEQLKLSLSDSEKLSTRRRYTIETDTNRKISDKLST